MPNGRDRREPAVPRDIERIDPERDVRVRITGTVLDAREDSIIIDDGSATTEVFINSEDMEEIEEGQRIRVLGRVLPTPDSFEIQGEIVQDMTDLDTELRSRVRDIADI